VGLRSFAKNPTHKTRILHASPSQIRFALRDKTKPNFLSKVSIGGGSLIAEELLQVDELLSPMDLYVTYGLTEAGPRVTTGHLTAEKRKMLQQNFTRHWIGSTIPGVQVWTEEKTNPGRLCVASPSLLKSQDGIPRRESFLKTRDQVEIIEGDVFFLSREEDLIKFGGVTIYPQEIESLVRAWPGVTDCLILPMEDSLYGHRPLLAIEGQASEEFITQKSSELPQGTAFKDFFILQKFPRKSLDKIDRGEILNLWQKRSS
jgi:acyl-CoA synthetase (AMP-forming)/AMP-acid ligase II